MNGCLNLLKDDIIVSKGTFVASRRQVKKQKKALNFPLLIFIKNHT